MTYREDFTLPAELLEQVSSQGLEILPELIRVLLNTAMPGQPATLTPTATPIIQTPQPTQSGWVGTSYTSTSAHRHAAVSAGSNSYAYDANGNMTCRGEQHYL